MTDHHDEPAAPATREPGRTGHRPARPITALTDPTVLALVLTGLHHLPDNAPPQQLPANTNHP